MVEATALSVRGLMVSYGEHEVVHGVDLDVDRGSGHALVGASGSGKTTVVRAIARLVRPSAGTVCVDGHDIAALDGRELRRFRHAIQVVFQEPQTSLDPRWRLGRSISEPLSGSHRARTKAVTGLLERVGLPEEVARSFPHELSIGQQQRAAIARAIAADPTVLICDEPVAALDMAVQAQVLDLLGDLQRERSIAVLLVTHDLAVAGRLCKSMSVLDAGRLIETGPIADLMELPRQGRTAAMVAAARQLDLGASRGRRD